MSRDVKYPDELTRQRYLEENFNKERDTRLRWYFTTLKPRQAECEGQKSKQYEVKLRKLQASCPKPTEELMQLRNSQKTQNSSADKNEIKLPKIQNKAEADTTTSLPVLQENVSLTLPPVPLRDMNQVDWETRGKIYDGSSREGKGRCSYLKARCELNPEEKYNFPVLSSWEYGWRLGEVVKVEEMKNPEFGRSRIVADTFYRSNFTGLSHKI